jgi:hypothetical protein
MISPQLSKEQQSKMENLINLLNMDEI